MVEVISHAYESTTSVLFNTYSGQNLAAHNHTHTHIPPVYNPLGGFLMQLFIITFPVSKILNLFLNDNLAIVSISITSTGYVLLYAYVICMF